MGAAASKRRSKILSVESKISCLKKTPFFLYLQDDLLEEFARCFQYIKRCNEGETVHIDVDNVYIVAQGELDLQTILPKPEAKVETHGFLCKKYPGDVIYQQQAKKMVAAKLSNRKLESYVEQVQTISCCNSILLQSDRKSLDLFLGRHQDLAEPINSIIDSHIETYLSNIPFFKGVKESQLTVLATMCRFESLDKEQIVFEENSPGDKLYILLNGSATVLSPQWIGNATAFQQSLEWGSDRGDDKVVVADLKSGDYFGETAMFVNINRTSTIVTKQKCLFVSVEKVTFENFCTVCPIIKDKMTSVMKERMVAKLSSLGIPFLVGIPNDMLRSMTDLAEVHEVDHKEVIFLEGQQGDRFYIIVHGQVKVETNSQNKIEDETGSGTDISDKTSDTKSVLGVLSAGNYFGEMALVSDSPRSATVSAIGKTVLLSLGKESFQRIFVSNDNASAEFSLRVLQASSELIHLLAHSVGLSTFKSYLKRNLAEENLDFWIATKEFKENSLLHSDKDKVLEQAKAIYELYCKEGAEYQVNLPCSIRTGIEKLLEKPQEESVINKHFFDKAQNEIYDLMVRDNYARFKRTPDFKEIFKCLGILIEYR